MSRAGVIEILLGMDYPARLERFVAIEATKGASPDPIARLAALAIVVREDAERLRERLRLSNAEYARLALAAGWSRSCTGAMGAFRRMN